MKKKLLVIVLASVMLTGCGKTIPKLSNGDEAIVDFKNGDKISVNEVWDEVKDSYGLNIILNKIDQKILEDKFKDKKNDIDEYIKNYETSLKANYTDKNGKFDETSLNNALSQYGYSSLDQLLSQQRLSYMENLQTESYAKSLVTDKEIEKYYKKDAKGDIKCDHILVKPASSSDQDANTALEKAKEIIKNIEADVKNGTSVTDAFKKYENDSSVTYQNLDFFNHGDMVEAFETAAYKLKKNEYTKEPVKTTYGYHVILKVDEKEKDTLENLKDKIRETLADEKQEKDSTIAINAMIELRKEYGVNITDSDVEKAYNKYVNYLINNSKNTVSSN